MATFKKILAFMLVITMVLSAGEGVAFASGMPEGDPMSTPEPSVEPGPETTPEPSVEPETSAEPEATEGPGTTPEPETTPESSVEPTATPEPSIEPETTPEPIATVEPEATPEPSEEPKEEHKQWPWVEPGNSVSSLMSGGRTLMSGSSTYYSEGGLWVDDTLLASVDASNLNLADGWLYFSDGDLICRIPSGGGSVETVYAAGMTVIQMYVMGQEIRYLADGGLFSYDMNDGAVEQLDAPEGAVRFIPTQYGNLFCTGSVFNYTLWAEQTQLQSGITNCYTEGDWLVVVTGGETMQAAVSPMFEGAFALQGYSLHQELLAGSGLSDEQQLANEAAYAQSSQYAALQNSLQEYANNGIATVSTSTFLTQPLSSNQQNIVLRAQQMSEVTWSCMVDRYAWGGDDGSYVTTKGYDPIYKAGGKFFAGKTYKGVPYSQAVSTGYVGWDISLSKFIEATKDSGSVFYKNYSSFSRTAPYYGSDCSGFVSYAWDLPYRCTCTSLLKFSEAIGKDISKLQIGDVLNNPSSHVVLVTDIAYGADGSVVSVEITEQTPPKMKVTCYGELINGKTYDFTGKLNYITSYYFNGGYSIYRRACSSRPSVGRPEEVVGTNLVDAPTMQIGAAGPGQASVTLKHSNSGAAIYYTTNNTMPTTGSTRYTQPFTVSGAKVVIRAIAKVGDKDSFPLSETLVASQAPTLAVYGESNSNSVFNSNGNYYVDRTVRNVTLLSDSGARIYYTTNGSDPSINSSSAAAGAVSIPVQDGMTIKAFSAATNGIPSAVVTFKVYQGVMHKITVKDSFGLIAPASGIIDEGVLMVLDGASITLTIQPSTDLVELDHILVDGQNMGAPTSYTFENVTTDHTIVAVLKSPFTDVNGSSWYAGAVSYCKTKGLFAGTSATKFSPNGNITRAMFIAVLGRFAKPSIPLYGTTISGSAWESVSYQLGVTRGSDINVRQGAGTGSARVAGFDASGQYLKVLGSVDAANGVPWYQVQYNAAGSAGYVSSTYSGKTIVDVCNFTDLTGSGNKSVQYAYGYAQWAYLNDIVNGISSTSFGAKTAISREDICVMLYNYLTKSYGRSMSTTQTKTFTDSASISSYAKNAVNAMVNIGILQGDTSNRIQPKAAATRAQVAAMFMRLDQYMNG